MKELQYQKFREANSLTGAKPQTCCFYKELHARPGGDSTPTPQTTLDTSEESEPCAAGVNSEEEEEDGGHVPGRPSYTTSHDLFETPLQSNQSQQANQRQGKEPQEETTAYFPEAPLYYQLPGFIEAPPVPAQIPLKLDKFIIGSNIQELR
ncbi:hypothetical protein UY3_11866 [Chelonia mydas]|uniref:Uncharacterized protein n=1 Tax=Chelonia mydas TaxID=8469 RepID=M7B636_CHEMY|nr:hypothetical protein UY3_11866 [Chelonia mydas]